MKKTLCIVFAVLLLLTGCTPAATPTPGTTATPDGPAPTATPEKGEAFNVGEGFAIIKSFQATPAENAFASQLQAAIQEATGIKLPIRTDITPEKDNELIVGLAVHAQADKKGATLKGNDWMIQYADKNKVLFIATNESGYASILDTVKTSFINGTTVEFHDKLNIINAAPPDIIRISPENGSDLVSDLTPIVLATFVTGVGIDTTKSTVKVDGVAVTELEWEADSVKGLSHKLENGKHTLEISLTDTAGNVTTESAEFTVKPISDFKLYRGEIHSHSGTVKTDAVGTLDEAYTHARDEAKFDFYALTDHSYYFTWDQYNELYIPGADKYNEDGKFVALYGYEMTWLPLREGHINVIMPVKHYNSLTGITLQEFYESMKYDLPSVGQFNHTDLAWGKFEDYTGRTNSADESMSLFEFQSTSPFTIYEYYYAQALSMGWHLSPTHNEDNHAKQWGTTNKWHTVALADELTRGGIMEALHQGRTYITDDRTLELTFTVNGSALGSTVIANGPSVDIHIELKTESSRGLGKIELVGNNGVTVAKYDGKKAASLTWDVTVPADSDYFYLRTNSNSIGMISAPIYIKHTEYIDVTSSIAALGDNGKHGLQVEFNVIEPLTDVKVEYWLDKQADTDLTDEADTVVNVGNVDASATATGFVNMNRAAKTFITARISGKTADGKLVQHVCGKFTSPIYITEVVNLTASHNGIANAFTYIEVYNNTNSRMDLSSYDIALFGQGDAYLDKAIKNGFALPKQSYLAPGTAGVIWIKSMDNNLTADDFNTHYGTSLKEGETLFSLNTEAKLPTSTTHRTHLVIVNAGTIEVTRVTYNYLTALRGKEFQSGKSIEYGIHDLPSKDQCRFATKADPTPGTVKDGQIPKFK